MEMQAVSSTWVRVVGESIRHLINNFQSSAASQFLIVIREATLQGGRQIKARALIPDLDINALFGDFHLNSNRGLHW